MKYRIPVTITLVDEEGNPVANAKVKLYIKKKGESDWGEPKTIYTDAVGTATTTVVLEVPGTYDFRLVYDGSDEYEASEVIVTKTIKPKPVIRVYIVG